MKKIIAFMLVCILCFAFAGCNNNVEKLEPKTESIGSESEALVETEPATEEIPEVIEGVSLKDTLFINSEPYVITVERGFDNAGFTMLYVDEDDTYTFTAKDSENVEWCVYVLDEQFTDNARFIPQAYETALVGDGSLEIKNGQFIYISCSINSFTAEEIIEGPTYEIFR